MTKEKQHIFGPVPSRRLGLSLGVDIVPFKVCTLDCIYCQIGKTTEKTLQRKDYCDVNKILTELKERLSCLPQPDFITISGSGEPTLNVSLGKIIEGIKKITDVPVAVLTNGTLFTDKSVRTDCLLADVVLPSLDAGDEETFQRINRPHSDISIERFISGLCEFRAEFSGQIWLEVLLVEGLNNSDEQICAISKAIERIQPDKVQLNTAVRPTADAEIKAIDPQKLQAIAEKLPGTVEVVADFSHQRCSERVPVQAEDVLSVLKRRPCTLEDICSGLGISRNEALKYVEHLQGQGLVSSEQKDEILFFKAD